ncbi:hypothetical protein EIP86_010011 [Pleurotus ostreatoroseus]|nr:hypothetical protein EIP86_010011 [Pleurotus ostreatoroseus]
MGPLPPLPAGSKRPTSLEWTTDINPSHIRRFSSPTTTPTRKSGETFHDDLTQESDGQPPQIHFIRLAKPASVPLPPSERTHTRTGPPSLPEPAKTPAVQVRVISAEGNIRESPRVVWRLHTAPPYIISTGTRVNLRDSLGVAIGITRTVTGVASLGKSWITFRLEDAAVGGTHHMLLAVPIIYTRLTWLMRLIHVLLRGRLEETFPEIALALALPLRYENRVEESAAHLAAPSVAPRPSGKASRLADAIILQPLPPPTVPGM